MATEILVPDIGDFSEVDVIEVLVKAGDTLAVDDPMMTLESDKASMEIPAPQAGRVSEVKLKVGDKVSQGTLILLLETADEPMAKTSVAVREVSAGEHTAVPPAQPSPSEEEGEQSRSGRVYASPSVRRIARELDIDLTQVPATGSKGRVTKEDVQNFAKGADTTAEVKPVAVPDTASGMAIPPIPAVDFSQFGEIEQQPLSRIQKLSGPFLHRAWLNVPMVTHHDEADMTGLEDFRQSLKPEAEKRGVRVTSLVFVMKALACSLQAFPRFNSSLAPDAQSLIFKKYYHIGIAVDTPNGLVVPVVRDVDKKSIYQLSAELAGVSKKARDGKLTPKDMSGGCISISSLGGIGGTAFTPIVNAPEVAILGVTRSQMKPVWNGQEFIPRLMTPLDLTYDHRVIDGAEAARFMVHLCQTLGDIRRILL